MYNAYIDIDVVKDIETKMIQRWINVAMEMDGHTELEIEIYRNKNNKQPMKKLTK